MMKAQQQKIVMHYVFLEFLLQVSFPLSQSFISSLSWNTGGYSEKNLTFPKNDNKNEKKKKMKYIQ